MSRRTLKFLIIFAFGVTSVIFFGVSNHYRNEKNRFEEYYKTLVEDRRNMMDHRMDLCKKWLTDAPDSRLWGLPEVELRRLFRSMDNETYAREVERWYYRAEYFKEYDKCMAVNTALSKIWDDRDYYNALIEKNGNSSRLFLILGISLSVLFFGLGAKFK
jgi:hypothetical protein